MPRLPRISGRAAARAFEKAGWEVSRQRGSHVVLTKAGVIYTLSIPLHRELGRGLAEYSFDEAVQLAGCHSENIEAVLGYRGRAVMVHRDELVVFDRDDGMLNG